MFSYINACVNAYMSAYRETDTTAYTTVNISNIALCPMTLLILLRQDSGLRPHLRLDGEAGLHLRREEDLGPREADQHRLPRRDNRQEAGAEEVTFAATTTTTTTTTTLTFLVHFRPILDHSSSTFETFLACFM